MVIVRLMVITIESEDKHTQAPSAASSQSACMSLLCCSRKKSMIIIIRIIIIIIVIVTTKILIIIIIMIIIIIIIIRLGQLSVSMAILMVFACAGFLSPANRGALMQVITRL